MSLCIYFQTYDGKALLDLYWGYQIGEGLDLVNQF